MSTSRNTEGSEYNYTNVGFPDPDTTDQYRHYQHLRGQQQQNTYNGGKTGRGIKPVRIKSTAGNNNQACCKRPPWWGWLLVVIGLVIVGGLAAVLFFILQGSPKQSTPESLNAGTPTGANCQALYSAGYMTSGVHTISPDGVNKMQVYCEQTLENGGWTVFQRRFNGQVNFNRVWSEYRNGFGDVAEEHWLGNEKIHLLTAAGNQKLKIEMTHPDGILAYADFLTFWIENESNKYRLHVSGFTDRTPPGDAFSNHNGEAFSTLDRDNDQLPDGNCAQKRKGGWWFRACHPSHLNGLYNGIQFNGIIWYPWTTGNQSLVTVRMMVKTA